MQNTGGDGHFMIMPPPPAGLGDGVKGRHEGAESSNNNISPEAVILLTFLIRATKLT